MIRLLRKYSKVIAAFLGVNFIAEIAAPLASYALTSGPSQPEFSSFEPVTTTNMVDPFTGSFTYNLPVIEVPGPNGAGYAASLSYHSGVKPEEEASWVGYGWTLNPGSINRNMRGVADDHNNSIIEQYNKGRTNWTVSGGYDAGIEIFSFDVPLFLSVGGELRYNRYRGFSKAINVGLYDDAGQGNLRASFDNTGGRSFSASVNPSRILSVHNGTYKNAVQKEKELNDAINSSYRDMWAEMGTIANAKINSKRATSQVGSFHLGMSTQSEYKNTMGVKYTGLSATFSTTFQVNVSPLHIGPEPKLHINYSYQRPVKKAENSGFGMMYQEDALDEVTSGITGWDVKEGSVMDYYVEKESPYSKRDFYLPIPFQNYDMFSVSGEGLGGSFRLHKKNVGNFYPTPVRSSTPVVHTNLDFSGGLNTGIIGVDFGGGNRVFEVDKWAKSRKGNTDAYSFDDADNPNDANVFRFMGDKGGNVVFNDAHDPYAATIKGFGVYEAVASGAKLPKQMSSDIRPGESTLVSHNTISEMLEKIQDKDGNDVFYNSYNKRADIRSFFLNSSSGASSLMGKTIGEFATIGSGGQTYVYGLPVFNSHDKSISFEADPDKDNEYLYRSRRTSSADIDDDLNGTDIKTIRGQAYKSPYASTYLLTEITGANYIDRTMDGPSNDDFGAWTKFNYRQAYGSDHDKEDEGDWGGWYHWRVPYAGFAYTKNDFSDRNTDMCSFSSGNKEIYYTESIETKTHIAYFITNKTDINVEHVDGTINLLGSDDDRADALEAPDDHHAGDNYSAKGTDTKEFLEKIVLYAKNDDGLLVGQPLKTVHLEYYEDGVDTEVLCKGIPNSANTGTTPKGGKLTLKRVWFEYQGITNARIRPYEFKYEYKPYSEFGSEVQTKYPEICKYEYVDQDDQNPELFENPDYVITGSDGWGNYRSDGNSRASNLRPWVDQYGTTNTFDPAAWNLKRIMLPSGGEILVQYEQHDYQYVQNREALAMVSLGNSGTRAEPGSDNKYYLNLDDVDIERDGNGDLVDQAVTDYVAKINDYLDGTDNSGEKAYFKFLYKLRGMTTDPALDNCKSGYITGYVDATAYKEGTGASAKIYLSFDGNDAHSLPYDVCLDYMRKNKHGLDLDNDCDRDNDFGEVTGDVAETFLQLINSALPIDVNNNCVKISLKDSYLRVPLPGAKKGGGIRVKRLLMYDDGVESGDEVLYGTEYIYKDVNGNSSGVATNEPNAIREENALIRFDKKRADQGIISKVIAGDDVDQFENPYGESLLPASSIGYSRIVTKNIHEGETGTGYTVSEYYTNYDYPTIHWWDPTGVNRRGFPIYLPIPHLEILIDNRSVSQGYSFVLSNMHGQMKKMATYPGTYDPNTNLSGLETSLQEYTYTAPGEKVDVLHDDGTISQEFVGREDEIAIEMRSAKDKSNDLALQFDADLAWAGPIPIPQLNAFPSFNYHETQLDRHVNSKVIRYTPVLKSVRTKQDGLESVTVNKVYDSNTGEPIITEMYDSHNGVKIGASQTEHDGRYVNYTVPAAKVYRNMGQKAKSENFAMTGEFQLYSDHLGEKPHWLNESAGLCWSRNTFINLQDASNTRDDNPPVDGSAHPLLTSSRQALINAWNNGWITLGDLIELSDNSGNKALFYINEFDDFHFHRIYVQPVSFLANDLIDGNAEVAFTKLEVIRSGYTNNLGAPAAAITTYGEDIISPIEVTGEGKVQLNENLDNIVAASVTSYTDDWYNYALTLNYEDVDYECSAARPFETGARGKWRPRATFAYRDEIEHGVDVGSGERVYNAGTFVNDFETYIFKESDNKEYYSAHSTVEAESSIGEYQNYPVVDDDSRWVETNRINMYSPHGEPLEEQNKLGVRSTAKFGYQEKVPVLVAANAAYETVGFLSFEDDGSPYVTTDDAHSGYRSAKVLAGKDLNLGSYEAPDVAASGTSCLVKFWVKADQDIIDDLSSNIKINFNAPNDYTYLFYSGVNFDLTSFTQIARVGEWTLFEGIIEDDLSNGSFYFDDQFKNGRYPKYIYTTTLTNLGTKTIYIDDFRIQPIESQMTTYVYDPENLRLLASFDDQHFGMYYQYNKEGQLVRKIIETERGMKTVTETQYNVPLTNR